MIRTQAGAAARAAEAIDRGFAAPDAGEVARRIASLVGEIDALKRERHAAPVLGARTALAVPYFRKRPAQPRAGA